MLSKNTVLHSTMCEILAPAGDKNSAIAAINSGADAIYLGLKQFSARSSADNFDISALKEIINYAAVFGVKVHVAMNTLVKQDEVENFLSAVKEAWNCGADAIIMQDIFLGRAVHEAYPQITLHLSTQAGVCNEYGALLAKEFGFSRVILARETAFEDIERIAKIIETEVFVQGALCTCFSGQCYFSSFAGGNSGNRGRCKQPCRKLYSMDRKGFEGRAYRLSPSDLCAGDNIIKLKESGVYSFKIEGRMRRPEYVAAAVNYYRAILCGGKGDISALRRTFNRGNYTRGLAFGQDKSFLSPAVQGHLGEYVGTVKIVNGRALCESGQHFKRGDGFKILRSGSEVCGGAYDGDCKGGFYIAAPKRLKNGDKVFVTTDTALNERLTSGRRLLKVDIFARFTEGEYPRVSINGCEFTGGERLGSAQSRPLTSGDIVDCFRKVGELPFDVSFGDVAVEGNPYLGMAALNAFRRAAYENFLSLITFKERFPVEDDIAVPETDCIVNTKTAVICSDLNGVQADIGILKPDDYFSALAPLIKDFDGEKYLCLPAYLRGDDIEKLKPVLKLFDGVYCEGYYGIVLAREQNMPFFAGVGYNVSNTFAAKYLSECAKYFCISKELSLREAAPLRTRNAFMLSVGGIKVMDLIYCPFGRTCSACDRRRVYTLTDESGRKFPLKRYELSSCRFELYNCANLYSENTEGRLCDFTLLDGVKLSREMSEDRSVKHLLGDITRGHINSPVL